MKAVDIIDFAEKKKCTLMYEANQEKKNVFKKFNLNKTTSVVYSTEAS